MESILKVLNNNNLNNNEMAKLYFDLYIGCNKYKQEKNKDINCDNYYESFLIHINNPNTKK